MMRALGLLAVAALAAGCGGEPGVDPPSTDPGRLDLRLTPEAGVGAAIVEVSGAVTSVQALPVPGGAVRLGSASPPLRVLVRFGTASPVVVLSLQSPDRKANSVRVTEAAGGAEQGFMAVDGSRVTAALVRP